jgi:hypothetical protein
MVGQQAYDAEMARLALDTEHARQSIANGVETGVWSPQQADALCGAIDHYKDSAIRLLRHVYFGGSK